MMPADAGRELAGVEAAGGAGDVAHQPGGELDLVQDPQDREQRPQVGGHGLLEREQLVHLLLDLQDQALDLPVRGVDLLDERRGRRRGAPGSRRRSARSSWPRASRPRCGSPAAARRTTGGSRPRCLSGCCGGRCESRRQSARSRTCGRGCRRAAPVHLSFTRAPPRTLRRGLLAVLRCARRERLASPAAEPRCWAVRGRSASAEGRRVHSRTGDAMPTLAIRPSDRAAPRASRLRGWRRHRDRADRRRHPVEHDARADVVVFEARDVTVRYSRRASRSRA